MPRFVILRHEPGAASQRELHWDFMLEDGDRLLTWALGFLPQSRDSLAALRLPDHRLEYLDYEGPISGDRGTVSRCDRGDFAWKNRSASELVVELQGTILRGLVSLRSQSDDGRDWTMSLRDTGSFDSPLNNGG